MNILISGYYGFDNIGDEAVLLGIITLIRNINSTADITVMSANPNKTRQLYAVNAIDRNSRNEIETVLKNTDLFISGGGSLLQDITSWRSPLYYLYTIHLALKHKVKTVIALQGIGPLKRKIIQFLTKLVLNKVSYISLRDNDSKELLTQIGVTKPEITVAGDPALTLEIVKSDRIDRWLSESIPADKSIIGLALRPVKSIDIKSYSALINITQNFANEHNSTLLFIPFFCNVDLPFAQKLVSEMKLEDDYVILDIQDITPLEMIYLISCLDRLVAVRLHAIIFAALTSTITTAVSYDPKVQSFCDEIGISCTDIDHINDENLIKLAIHNAESADKGKVDTIRESVISAVVKMLK